MRTVLSWSRGISLSYVFLIYTRENDSWSWSLGDGQYKGIVCMSTWRTILRSINRDKRELSTKSWINHETRWSRRFCLILCVKLSESGRVVHSLLGFGLCTGAYQWGTFITGSVIHSGSDVQQVLELKAVVRFVGCRAILMTPTRLLLMLQCAEDHESVWSVV